MSPTTAQAPPTSTTPRPPNSVKYTIEPVTSEADLPALAYLSGLALGPDPYSEFRERYGPQSLYDDTLEKLTNAMRDKSGQSSLFKVVLVPDSDEESGKETVIGLSQWRLGYLNVPKTDPFAIKRDNDAPSSTAQSVETTVVAKPNDDGEAEGLDIARAKKTPKPKPFYSNPLEEHGRMIWNSVITHIRGKRFMGLHRLVVHPSYQRQGIGQQLINWGTEVADRENVVSWLNARPAGSRLYERNGWQVVDVVEFDSPELDVPHTVTMIRFPKPRLA
ncbi:hypothetical protein PV08_05779 [Exophiala spinifera]|uniref:N-acetyltransferase domain-containing protein n=1 Tax=Exophiala spinifera TaxID=91928 RepID=A0A0D2BWQ6_9EURO|nr:uncharacterized protein PV08_05779 [Exophiala spinifera]KIW15729.1 hypothetical protein PV08_05779 [Exophiala spinifera]